MQNCNFLRVLLSSCPLVSPCVLGKLLAFSICLLVKLGSQRGFPQVWIPSKSGAWMGRGSMEKITPRMVLPTGHFDPQSLYGGGVPEKGEGIFPFKMILHSKGSKKFPRLRKHRKDWISNPPVPRCTCLCHGQRHWTCGTLNQWWRSVSARISNQKSLIIFFYPPPDFSYIMIFLWLDWLDISLVGFFWLLLKIPTNTGLWKKTFWQYGQAVPWSWYRYRTCKTYAGNRVLESHFDAVPCPGGIGRWSYECGKWHEGTQWQGWREKQKWSHCASGGV